MRDHRDLEAWRKAIDLAVDTYTVTRHFPRGEQFGLSSQMRRAAVSIASNIAEGAARRTTKDFIAFAHIARGSLAELETQIAVAVGVDLPIQAQAWTARIDELGRLINGLIRSLQKKVSTGTHLK